VLIECRTFAVWQAERIYENGMYPIKALLTNHDLPTWPLPSELDGLMDILKSCAPVH